MMRIGRRATVSVTGVALLAGLLVTAPVAAAAPPAAPLPAPPLPAAPCSADGPEYTYVVVHRELTPRSLVDTELRRACAEPVTYYPEIGVSVARSAAADFPQRIGPERTYSGGRDVDERAAAVGPRALAGAERESERTVAVARDAQEVAGAQWDMDAIRAPEARAIDPGRASVTVGVLDTGIEAGHPAFARTLDRERSVGCLTGAPRGGEANWTISNSDHGTHVAGTIAGDDAAATFAGVAPGVRVASVKVVNDDGLIFPEAAVCGFMWAAQQRFAVTNSSYYVDPGYFYCRDVAGQGAVVEAVRRAVRWATLQGSTAVAAAGNSAFDATAQTVDPNRATPVGPGCAHLPAGTPGVVTVSATGFAGTKASYSNWGAGLVDVTAPGGDSRQPVPGRPSGCVLSAIAGGGYGYKCGTSMAAPHAAGVLALLAGRVPPPLAPRLLVRQADPVACSSSTCSGPPERNSHYGSGLVDALEAVTGPGSPRR